LLLAKVQILQLIGNFPITAWPILRLDTTNTLTIVRLDEIGSVIVIGAHPDGVTTNQFVVLPWPRQLHGTRAVSSESDLESESD